MQVESGQWEIGDEAKASAVLLLWSLEVSS